jgi:hypothetical protein
MGALGTVLCIIGCFLCFLPFVLILCEQVFFAIVVAILAAVYYRLVFSFIAIKCFELRPEDLETL